MRAIVALGGLFATLFTSAAPLSASPTQTKASRCDIGSAGGAHYKGPCRFFVEKGGSFSVSRPRGGPLIGLVTIVSVTMTDPGAAEVRGVTTTGANSRWGEAKRSKKDPACWRGSDFWVCAY